MPPAYHRGAPYRVAHACFECRISFKINVDIRSTEPVDKPCPHCGARLHWMGRSFKPPGKRNIAQWRKVEALWRAGFRFSSYRSHPEAEPMPETPGQVPDFVARNPNHPFRRK